MQEWSTLWRKIALPSKGQTPVGVRPIRLLFVDHAPVAGGAQLVLVEHIAALDRERFDVHVACTDSLPYLVAAFRKAGATVHLLEMPRLRGLNAKGLLSFARSIRALRGVIRDCRIGLVISNTTRASYIASAAVPGTGAPLVWWVRDFFYPRRLFRMMRRIPVRVLYVSEALRRFYGDREASNALVWPVASDLYKDLATIGPEAVRSARVEYGFADSDIVIGFMGRLVEEKGAADVIAAVSTLFSELPRLRLLVVGSGAGQANDAEPRLRRMVEERGLTSIVRFAGHQTAQALHYSLFDLFVMATRDHEAYPTSVVQGMMAGKPVIASDVGGNPEIVLHERTGLLYRAGDVTALAAAIRRMVSDRELSTQLAKAAYDQVMTNNRGEQLARKAEELYWSVGKRRDERR